jgi:hypothetical protein
MFQASFLKYMDALGGILPKGKRSFHWTGLDIVGTYIVYFLIFKFIVLDFSGRESGIHIAA